MIPLPTMRACPETNSEALYAAGTTVMAIYPQTTCFYKGVIKAQPAAGKLHPGVNLHMLKQLDRQRTGGQFFVVKTSC